MMAHIVQMFADLPEDVQKGIVTGVMLGKMDAMKREEKPGSGLPS